MVVKKKDIQNDRMDLANIKMYKEYQESRKLIDNSLQPIKPMKYNVNNVLNMKLLHVKNAPIMGSDKIKQPSIPNDKVFKGTEAFPTLKKIYALGKYVEINIYCNIKMKIILSDAELQKLSENMREFLTFKYKDEISDVPEHIVDVLCQNYIINCKNNNIDIDELFDKYGISDKVS